MERRRAFVMVYAVCTLVLISSLSFSMVDSTGSDLEIAKLRMYQAFARVNAESGIEYAMGFVTRELGKHPDVANGIDGGPWLDIGYNFRFTSNPWFWSLQQRAPTPLTVGTYTSYNSQAEGPPFRLHEILGGPGAALIQASQFQIALAPTMTYANVKLATVGPPSRPTIFTIRSRGEVLQNPTGTRPIVMGSAYATLTFAVPYPTGNCGTPRPLRQVFDRNPASLTPAGMLPPNPH